MRTVPAVGTKCSIPRLPETLVRRPRLETLFANEARSQVTLVCGAPGAGKTTLLASWLAAAPVGQVAWLTLDRRDNESRRFATLVTVALERAGALAGLGSLPYDGRGPARRRVRAPGPPGPAVRAGARRPPGAGVAHRPAHPSPPGRAGAAGPRPGAGVPGRPAGAVGPAADGGPAEPGPQRRPAVLARGGRRAVHAGTASASAATTPSRCASAPRGGPPGCASQPAPCPTDADPRGFVLSASATQVAVSDYLLTEVLDRQDEAAQQFLLRTSVVGRLTPDLAVSLTGDPRAGERLNALERRGIFLVELDEDGSYRYHALFGALLRARLRLSDRPLFTALHRKAALWHLANGLPREAEEHARSAGEWSLVGRLVLDRWLEKALDGKRPLDDLTAGLSAGAVGATPELSLVAAAQACWRSDRAEADLHRHVIAQVTLPGGTATAVWALARRVLDVEYARGVRRRRPGPARGPRAGRPRRRRRRPRCAGPGAWPRCARPSSTWSGAVTRRRRRGLGRLVAVLASGRPEGSEARGSSAASIVRPDRLPGEPAQSAGDEGAAWSAAAAGLLALDEALAGRLVAADGHGAAARALAAAARPRDGLPHAGGLAAALCCAQRGEPRGLSEALDTVDGRPAAQRHLGGGARRGPLGRPPPDPPAGGPRRRPGRAPPGGPVARRPGPARDDRPARPGAGPRRRRASGWSWPPATRLAAGHAGADAAELDELAGGGRGGPARRGRRPPSPHAGRGLRARRPAGRRRRPRAGGRPARPGAGALRGHRHPGAVRPARRPARAAAARAGRPSAGRTRAWPSTWPTACRRARTSWSSR